ncbi:MAG: hypothetical protein KIY12_07685 [Thermoplasmata archaeon]|uniref:Uncharacterized protein n=1 Tax=Candidatus Sysuiplasma superficiale TaxID=2823368 RepID=A0A8J7YMG8_9ARCH|nr:hypothetical protein [Candidatus Sysuiplasma superficiale]MBX8644584.1 hypothetical protein [Candidatus Sysuiplasma superficiale]MCL4346567.1 hypothetical protein [Candidatus Thermoplasmatota archaeon]
MTSGENTAPQQAEQKRGNIESEVATMIETATHTTIVVAGILFGLVLDFIAQIILVVSSGPGTSGYTAGLILSIFGNFIILAILFIAGIVKRDSSDYMRVAYLIAAGLVFIATMRLI